MFYTANYAGLNEPLRNTTNSFYAEKYAKQNRLKRTSDLMRGED